MEERRRQAEEQRKKELHDVKMQLLEEMKGKSPGEVGDMVDKLFD